MGTLKGTYTWLDATTQATAIAQMQLAASTVHPVSGGYQDNAEPNIWAANPGTLNNQIPSLAADRIGYKTLYYAYIYPMNFGARPFDLTLFFAWLGLDANGMPSNNSFPGFLADVITNVLNLPALPTY